MWHTRAGPSRIGRVSAFKALILLPWDKVFHLNQFSLFRVYCLASELLRFTFRSYRHTQPFLAFCRLWRLELRSQTLTARTFTSWAICPGLRAIYCSQKRHCYSCSLCSCLEILWMLLQVLDLEWNFPVLLCSCFQQIETFPGGVRVCGGWKRLNAQEDKVTRLGYKLEIKISKSTSHCWEKRTQSSGTDSSLHRELQKCSFCELTL